MILDVLPQWSRYAGLSPRLRQAFHFLEQPACGSLGRVEIEGDDVYAIVQHQTTKPVQEKAFEAHRRYLDIHYVIGGDETLYWAPLSSLTHVVRPYNAENDEEMFALVTGAVPVPLRAGQFAIVFPHDGHIPLCAAASPSMVQKVVVKVRL